MEYTHTHTQQFIAQFLRYALYVESTLLTLMIAPHLNKHLNESAVSGRHWNKNNNTLLLASYQHQINDKKWHLLLSFKLEITANRRYLENENDMLKV